MPFPRFWGWDFSFLMFRLLKGFSDPLTRPYVELESPRSLLFSLKKITMPSLVLFIISMVYTTSWLVGSNIVQVRCTCSEAKQFR